MRSGVGATSSRPAAIQDNWTRVCRKFLIKWLQICDYDHAQYVIHTFMPRPAQNISVYVCLVLMPMFIKKQYLSIKRSQQVFVSANQQMFRCDHAHELWLENRMEVPL